MASGLLPYVWALPRLKGTLGQREEQGFLLGALLLPVSTVRHSWDGCWTLGRNSEGCWVSRREREVEGCVCGVGGAPLGHPSQVTHVEGNCSCRALRRPQSPTLTIHHSTNTLSSTSSVQGTMVRREIKHRLPDPSHGDPDCCPESWNPGDSCAQGGLSTQVSRDTSSFCICNLAGCSSEPCGYSLERFPTDSAKVLGIRTSFPQTRAWPSFPDSHIPQGLGQEQDKGFSGIRNTQLGV